MSRKYGCKFMHFRNIEETGNGSIVDSRGGATVAYVQGEDGISFAVAYCHPNDNYNKRLGRAKAAGRLLSERYSRQFKGDLFSFAEVIEMEMAHEEGLLRKYKE